MAAFARTREMSRAVLVAAAVCLFAGPAPAQVLPWEVAVAEIETGRLRNLAQRLSKQNLLFQLHLGGVTKADVAATAAMIDRVLRSLENGSPSYSIPAPWNRAIREQVKEVDRAWGTLREIALARPYDYLKVQRYVPEAVSAGDPLLLRYFDDLSLALVAESEKLLELYDAECVKTGMQAVCPAAKASGLSAMLIEKATKEAVYVVAGIDAKENRARLEETVATYQRASQANDESPFFAAALDPDRSANAKAAGQLLVSLRGDWSAMRNELSILAAGDEENFDLHRMLVVQNELVGKVERLTAALLRYASVTYGS